jgi:cell division protein FtsB
MKPVTLSFLAIAFLCLLPVISAAQEEGYQQTYEMSPLEQSFKQRYETLSAWQQDLLGRIHDLQDLKQRVDYIIDVVQSQPTTNAGLSAEKYTQLQSLLPVGMTFSRDLQFKEAQMAQLIATREALKQQLLRWRGSLPRWWVE